MKRLDGYSQHFLRSPRLVGELIGHSNIRKNDLVYDLGAGSGIIATQLAWRCREVVAVEIEPTAFEQLQRNAATHDNITCLKQDIMKIVFADATYKVFANIPFHLSAAIVRRLATLD